jgi:hypothetical protein
MQHPALLPAHNGTYAPPYEPPTLPVIRDHPSRTGRTYRRSRLASPCQFSNSALLRQLISTALTPRHGAIVNAAVFRARVATIRTTLPSTIDDGFGVHQKSSSEVSPNNNCSLWSEESVSRN